MAPGAPYTHAEYIGLHDLVDNQGIDMSNLISIFTDRYPCSDCEPVLESFGFGAEGTAQFNSHVHWGICKYTREDACQVIIRNAVAAVSARGLNSLILRDPVVGQWVNNNA